MIPTLYGDSMEPDSWKPPKQFASIIAKHPEEADPVPDSSQDYYRRGVENLYDVK